MNKGIKAVLHAATLPLTTHNAHLFYKCVFVCYAFFIIIIISNWNYSFIIIRSSFFFLLKIATRETCFGQ